MKRELPLRSENGLRDLTIRKLVANLGASYAEYRSFAGACEALEEALDDGRSGEGMELRVGEAAACATLCASYVSNAIRKSGSLCTRQ